MWVIVGVHPGQRVSVCVCGGFFFARVGDYCVCVCVGVGRGGGSHVGCNVCGLL